MSIPEGYAEVIIPLALTGFARKACITFGVAITLNDIAAPEALADDISLLFDTTLGTEMDNQVTSGPVTLRIGQESGEALTVVGSQQYGGALSQSSMPSNVAALIKKSTARGGRRGRGRFYLPWCLADADVDDAGAIGAKAAALTADATSFLSGLNAVGIDGAPMVLLHREGETPEGGPNDVTALTCDLVVATQRRRLGR